MKVTIDTNAGFCFGVVKAIEKAENHLQKNKKLYCLGEIVHNESEVDRLQKAGLETIDYNTYKTLQNTTVLIRAHGEPPETYEIAKKNNLTLLDATCPLVLRLQKKIHATANQLKNDESIAIYGNPEHPEVVGLKGQAPHKTLVLKDATDIPELKNIKRIHLYSQTTKDKVAFEDLGSKIRKSGTSTVIINDSICSQVYNRKEELASFAESQDVLIFVGGKKSSNARVLFSICEKVNRRSHFVSHEEDIDPGWFRAGDHTGVSGATSSPPWLLERVAKKISNILQKH